MATYKQIQNYVRQHYRFVSKILLDCSRKRNEGAAAANLT